MDGIEEIRKRWGFDIKGDMTMDWIRNKERAVAQADIHALLAALDAATAERDAAIREIGVWAKKAGLAWAERDALKARVKELEGVWVSVLCSVKSAVVPQDGLGHAQFRNGWQAAIDYALQLLDKEAKPDA